MWGDKVWWEWALLIVAQMFTHGSCMYMGHVWTRDHYKHKLWMMRYKTRIITGIDPAVPDERFPEWIS
jgi:hypothetical protein